MIKEIVDNKRAVIESDEGGREVSFTKDFNISSGEIHIMVDDTVEHVYRGINIKVDELVVALYKIGALDILFKNKD